MVVFKAFSTGKARLIMLCSLMGPQLFCRLKCTLAWLARLHVNIWTWERPPVFMHNHDVSLQGVVLAECFVTPLVTSTFPFFFLLVCSFMSSQSCPSSKTFATAIPATHVVPDVGMRALDVVFQVRVAEEVFGATFVGAFERTSVGVRA